VYGALEPFGQYQIDWGVAQILALMADLHRDPKKRAAPFSPFDFLPKDFPMRAADAATTKQRALAGKVRFLQAMFGGELRDGAE